VQKIGIEFLIAFGKGFGFGFRPPGYVMPELRLGFLRIRIAIPELDEVLICAVQRRRSDADFRRAPPAYDR
jgi:hypothetical protein